MEAKEYEQKLYSMKLMETEHIGDYQVTSVPGGWIFHSMNIRYDNRQPVGYAEAMVFVPRK